MPPRTPTLPRIALLACALLLPACAERRREQAEPPETGGSPSAGGSGGSGSQCLPGGPSVSIEIHNREGGKDMPQDELGVLLAWIGGFAQPCREAKPEAERFTLEIGIGPAGQSPTLVLRERDALPSLSACLDGSFAKAPPPPPTPMTVEIVIPWGCPTLGPSFQAESATDEATSDDSPTP